MYKASTFFIKNQLPGLTVDHLLELYRNELEQQSVDSISINFTSIIFTNNNMFRSLTNYSNKYANFSEGRIDIEESDEEFIINLQANLSNLLIKPGLIAGIATLFLLLASGFEPFTLGIGLLVFIAMMIASYISMSISFPVYFTYFRNSIEYEFQRG